MNNFEKNMVLKLFKNVAVDYNPSTIAKELKKTRINAFLALKKLEKEGIVKGKALGKASFYKLNLTDAYVQKTVELLLMEEARKRPRWIDEFRDFYKYSEIAILFGSVLRNEEKADDIDILLVFKEKNASAIEKLREERSMILGRKVHLIRQTMDDLIRNIKKKDPVVLSAISSGIVLHGHEKLIDVIADVRS